MIGPAVGTITSTMTKSILYATGVGAAAQAATTIAGAGVTISNGWVQVEAKDADGKAQLPGLVTIPPIT